MSTIPCILREGASRHLEARLTLQHAMLQDIPLHTTSASDLVAFADLLRQGHALPVGSVEFVQQAMALAGIGSPPNMSYPAALVAHPDLHLHRTVAQCRAADLRGRLFIKPLATKAFTGFVMDFGGAAQGPGQAHPDAPAPALDALDDHDREQYNAFAALCMADAAAGLDTRVWTSTPVHWLSEVRCYVMDGRLLGQARYDDGADDAPLPVQQAIDSMIATMQRDSGDEATAPVAYSLDVGVMSCGTTALVECNDAWALGFYKGTLDRADYFQMLWRRWQQLLQLRAP